MARWISHHIIAFLQKVFGIVGIRIIRWPKVFITISVLISLVVGGVGCFYMFAVNPVMGVESLGASSKEGYQAYLMKEEYFKSDGTSTIVAITLKEGENAFKHMAKFCEMQRSFEDNAYFKRACMQDHTPEKACTKNMFDTILQSVNQPKTNDPAKDCSLFQGQLVESAIVGLGDQVSDLFGFPTKGWIMTSSDDEPLEFIIRARQILMVVSMNYYRINEESGRYAFLDWESEVFLPFIKKLQSEVEAQKDTAPQEGGGLSEEDKKLNFIRRIESVNYLMGNSLGDEATRLIFDDVPLIVGSFFLMFIYCICMLVRRWKLPFLTHTRFGLAFMMMLTATFALIIAYGFQGFMGQSFSALSLATAFIIYGVGIDDTFVVIDAYARVNRDVRRKDDQSIDDYIAQNILEAYVETSDAICLTTCTDCVAFFTGAFIDVQAMSGFCMTAGIAVLGVFILQSTFFLPCLVLDERRRLDKRLDILCCFQREEKKIKRAKKTVFQPEASTPTGLDTVRAMFTSKERFNFLGPFFTVPAASITVALFIAVGVFNGTYGWTHLNKNLDPVDFLAEDSYAVDFIDITLAAKEGNYPLMVDYIFDRVNFANPEHRAAIIRTYNDQFSINDMPLDQGETQRMQVRDMFGSSGVLAYLKDEYPSEFPRRGEKAPPRKSFPRSVDEWLETYPSYKAYFSKSKFTGWAATFKLLIHSVASFKQRAIHRTKMLNVAKASIPEDHDVNLYLFEPLFSQIDRYIGIEGYFLSSVLSSIAGVFIINCFFTLPLYATVSMICVIFVICHILVIFPILGIDFNILMVVNLILAIGFAVDYCAHIGQHFANNSQLNPKARALCAINTMAGSVLKAGFSTILAVIFLVFSRGLVTSTLLKCFLVMVFAGLLHALIFMPCSLFLLATATERFFPTKKSDPEITDQPPADPIDEASPVHNQKILPVYFKGHMEGETNTNSSGPTEL